MKIELLSRKCLPQYGSSGAGAMDCIASRDVEWEFDGSAHTAIVPLGFKVKVPTDHTLFIFSRSGMGFKQNISLANSVGVIDSDYRGEVMAKLIRHKLSLDAPIDIQQGDKVCQMILIETPKMYLTQVDNISDWETERGIGGFGSTGT